MWDRLPEDISLPAAPIMNSLIESDTYCPKQATHK